VTPAALCTHGLVVGYEGRRSRREVLRDLNLSVRPGELVCLLGPNGVGKSTLLRTIGKMQPALGGRIELGGIDLDGLSAIELARRLGVVLTERPVVGSLTARRVVELGRYPHSGWFGHMGARDLAAVSWALDAVGARPLADRDLSQLSDGERQRVMIARALVQEPVLLLLDEPAAFLDLPSRVELMGLLRRLARGGGLAIVLSTHDLELALRTADTVWLVMPDGRMRSGVPEDLVLAGDIAAAFESRHIRFHAQERTFRLVNTPRGRAVVHGTGLHAALATAVLEREGYAVDSAGGGKAARLTLHFDDDGRSWRASLRGRRVEGGTFAALAAVARDDEAEDVTALAGACP
jgi:iron complex transport system ATP-binding protein